MPIAIITGASKGLGFALGIELAKAGWDLIIDARDQAALGRAADALRTAGSATGPAGRSIRVDPIAGDITDPAHRAALLRTAQAHSRLDLLINNAGTLGPSPLPAVSTLDLDALRRTFEVNAVAPLGMTQLALPLLRTSRGVVIDITSDAAVEGYPGWGGYGASKAATEQLRNVLAAEESEGSGTASDRPGIRVWRVDPGDLRTDMHQLAFPGEDISDRPLPESVAPGIVGLLAARPPSGRYRLADYLIDETQAVAVDDGPDPAEVTGPIRLWLCAAVDDYAGVLGFYRDALALPEVDGWAAGDGTHPGGAGSVLAVGPDGRIEIEESPPPGPSPASGLRAALEYASSDALQRAHDELIATPSGSSGSAWPEPSPIVVHPRGHAGFTVRDPRGTELYLWTEKWETTASGGGQ